jgi:release factor glutamine methyltransferase
MINNINYLMTKFTRLLIKKGVDEPCSSIYFILMKSCRYNLNRRKAFDSIIIAKQKFLHLTNSTKFSHLIYKRIRGFPMQYILGEWYFRKYTIKCIPNVLIPRIETEKLIDLAIYEINRKKTADLTFLEIGIGTGAIFLTLLKEVQTLKANGIDINDKCIQLSKTNAGHLGICPLRYELIHCDFQDYISTSKFDFIVSNPPYIANDFQVMKELHYESGSALFSGEDGLDLIRVIIARSRELVKQGGFVLLEISPEQQNHLIDVLLKNGFNYFIFEKDIFERVRYLLYFI